MSCQVPVPELVAPGACSSSCDIWRPLMGRSCTSRSLTFTPMRAELRSSVGATPVTVTVSVTPGGLIVRSSDIARPAASSIPVYSVGASWPLTARTV